MAVNPGAFASIRTVYFKSCTNVFILNSPVVSRFFVQSKKTHFSVRLESCISHVFSYLAFAHPRFFAPFRFLVLLL